jgi:hypothetical protein
MRTSTVAGAAMIGVLCVGNEGAARDAHQLAKRIMAG